MKKFQFSLSHMRDYKDRILDEEMGVLQRLKAERDQIQDHIERLEKEFKRLSQKMKDAQEKGTTVLAMRGFSMQLENLRLQLRDLKMSLKLAERRVGDQTKVVIAANQEVSKLDKLQDRQYEEYQHHMAKAEEERIEELVTLGLTRQTAG